MLVVVLANKSKVGAGGLMTKIQVPCLLLACLPALFTAALSGAWEGWSGGLGPNVEL